MKCVFDELGSTDDNNAHCNDWTHLGQKKNYNILKNLREFDLETRPMEALQENKNWENCFYC